MRHWGAGLVALGGPHLHAATRMRVQGGDCAGAAQRHGGAAGGQCGADSGMGAGAARARVAAADCMTAVIQEEPPTGAHSILLMLWIAQLLTARVPTTLHSAHSYPLLRPFPLPACDPRPLPSACGAGCCCGCCACAACWFCCWCWFSMASSSPARRVRMPKRALRHAVRVHDACTCPSERCAMQRVCAPCSAGGPCTRAWGANHPAHAPCETSPLVIRVTNRLLIRSRFRRSACWSVLYCKHCTRSPVHAPVRASVHAGPP